MDDDTEDPKKESNVIQGSFGKSEEEPKAQMYRVGALTFSNGKGSWYSYEPRPDITAYESSRVMQLFLVSIINPKANLDRVGFINLHRLQRHFVVSDSQ